MKMLRIVKSHKIIFSALLVALAVGGYYGCKAATKTPALTKCALASVERGALITSVSGTGQVAASDQVDIKPKVSGQVVSVSVVKDQAVKEGAVLVQLDARAAKASVSDAEIALESAKIKLDDLLAPPDAQALLRAKNALAQLESARHMYNAITVTDYGQFRIASTIDRLQPRIESDTTSASAVINSLQKTLDDIDTAVAGAPDKIKDAELALKSAEEDVAEKRQVLAGLEAGPDAIDIRTQQNVVAQKEAALKDAREKLADTAIRAPFDGVIAAINVKKGDTVASGAVATLITEQKIAEITLNEIDVADIRVGQKATIAVDAVSDLSITGEVAEIDSVGTVSQGVVS